METVKNATEVFNMVMAEVKALKALDVDPLQKARIVAQLCSVAIQALALGEANWKAHNDWHMRQVLKQRP